MVVTVERSVVVLVGLAVGSCEDQTLVEEQGMVAVGVCEDQRWQEALLEQVVVAVVDC